MDSEQPVRYVPVKEGVLPWARCAHEVLVETASRYGGYITAADLAAEVQRRARRATRSGPKVWLPEVLSLVVRVCARAGEPPLTALVVDARTGEVGAAYEEVLTLLGLDTLSAQERENQAAEDRLECYRTFCAELPPDAAAQPAVIPTVRSVRSARPAAGDAERVATGERKRKGRGRPPAARPENAAAGTVRSSEQRQGAVCPSCSMVMPLRGGCPNCT